MSNMNWKVTTGLICSFGIFKDFRPSESFLTSYLTDPSAKNLSLSEINNEVYPIWTYSYLSFLVIVLLITDLLRYKPIVILEGISYIITWTLLLWADGILNMQIMQFTYGGASATEIAYYSYVYAAVTSTYFRRVSGFIRASSLAGRFLAASLGQILITFVGVSYFTLNIISMTNVCIAFVISVFLPKVKFSFYFHRKNEIDATSASDVTTMDNITTDRDSVTSNQKEISCVVENGNKTSHTKVSFLNGLRFMWLDFQSAYSQIDILLWSFWWSAASTGNLQMGNYIQNLWKAISPYRERSKNYNGAVDAISMLCSAATSFGIGFVKVNWSKYGELLLFSVNLIIGGLMLWMSFTNSIWIAYGCYLIIRIIFQTVLTIATYQVAVHLSSRCYGLVFGLNTFMALLLETIMTVIVVDKHGLNLDVRTQFAVYGGYFGVLSLPFLVKFFYNCFRKKNELQLKSVNVLEEPSK